MAAKTNVIKKRKSEHMTKQELSALKDYRKKFGKEVDCAIAIGIDRNVLNRISNFGSGNPENVNKIRAALSLNNKQI